MSDVAANPEVQRHYPVIADALKLAASPQLRNMATLGGNVLQRTRCTYFRDVSYDACNKRNPGSGCAAMEGFNRTHAVLGTSEQCIATYPGDFAQALIALDATVEITGKSGTRNMPFAQLHKPPGNSPQIETTLTPGELISGFLIQGRWPRSVYLKVRDRQSYEFALASAAVALDVQDGIVRDARVALGGVATVPWRAREAEILLKDQKFDDALARRVAEAAFATAAAKAQRLQDRARQARGRTRAASGRDDGDLSMSIAAPEPKANMGQPVPRYDAVAKVTGKADYAADVPLAHPAYAYLVTSAIAKGRIDGFDLADAKKVRGVIDIVTHENAEKLKEAKLFSNGGYASTTIQPLKSADIARGRPDRRRRARRNLRSRARGRASREGELHRGETDHDLRTRRARRPRPPRDSIAHKDDPKVGDFAKAFDEAEVKFAASYETPTQHHNPMELFATSCVWNGDRLTIYEPSQYVHGLKNGVAEQLGIDADKVRVINSYVGGAFGSKGSMTPRTAIIASIAPRAESAGQAGRNPRSGLYHRDLSCRDPARDPDRRQPRRQADRAAPRGLGNLVARRRLRRRRHQDHDAALCLPECRQPGLDRARRPQHARLHALAARSALYVRAGKRDGRSWRCS